MAQRVSSHPPQSSLIVPAFCGIGDYCCRKTCFEIQYASRWIFVNFGTVYRSQKKWFPGRGSSSAIFMTQSASFVPMFGLLAFEVCNAIPGTRPAGNTDPKRAICYSTFNYHIQTFYSLQRWNKKTAITTTLTGKYNQERGCMVKAASM